MNKKLIKQLYNFRKRVGWYLRKEYKAKYSVYYKDYPLSIQNLVESYYIGGNNVPDTAIAVVEYIRKNINEV